MPLAVTGLRSLGTGVAFTLHAPELTALHRRLADLWREHLIPQDRQPFSPHIVVQNKTTAAHARATLAELQASFSPHTATATGLDLFRYLHGPWQPLAHYPFTQST